MRTEMAKDRELPVAKLMGVKVARTAAKAEKLRDAVKKLRGTPGSTINDGCLYEATNLMNKAIGLLRDAQRRLESMPDHVRGQAVGG